MGLNKKKLGIILVTAFLLLMPARASAATVSDISTKLICQCGCTLVLLNCNHTECGSREAMTTFIADRLDEGQSEAQIIQTFVSEYGEQVLASPPKKGFNLAAWITPFAAILLGGVVIYVALKKWVRRGSDSETSPPVDTEEDEEYRQRLEQELEVFTERSFR